MCDTNKNMENLLRILVSRPQGRRPHRHTYACVGR